jgi:DNA polymerase IV
MGADALFGSSSPAQPTESGRDIFSSQPIIFILPTHLSLDKLHETESRLVEHGGKITYDITEAGLVLGKIGQKKRAALELRSRGVWTEELPSVLVSDQTISSGDKEPPVKRRKVEESSPPVSKEAGPEIIDLATESESEEDGVATRHDSSQRLIQVQDAPSTITVLKLEWLDRSISAGKAFPRDPFLVYKGQKTKSLGTVAPAQLALETLPSQILQRAKADAASQPPPVPTSRFLSRRSKEPHDGTSKPPTLYRTTTSENDETATPPDQPDWVRDQVLYACLRSAPLHTPNADFISQLIKIRRIRELTLDEIGVRAYSTSIATLSAYPHVLKRPSEVLALPGCDVKIANLFSEFQQHGGCNHTDENGVVAAADALDTDPTLSVLNMFNKIWGVGAKTAREFYYKGWRDLDDIVEYGWNSLSRVQQIGVKFFDEFEAGVSRKESETIAEIVGRHARRVRPDAGDIDCIIVGGYRRGKEISGDIDIILSHRDESVTRNLIVDVVSSLEKEAYITHTLSLHLTSTNREQSTLPYRGEDTGKHFDSLDKALVVWQDPFFESADAGDVGGRKRNPNPHRRVDIIISPWHTVGCAVLGWSGDTTFQRDLRRYAKKAHGWKFDSSGVRERTAGGQVVDLECGGETWEERERLVMEGLGIGWRPPEERCTR